jgi:FkbM family methyltransferase
MSVGKYRNLFRRIANPIEYLFHKNERHRRDLTFTSKPNPITFRVPASVYFVFKEIFMGDVYELETLLPHLPASPVIIDIGANAGFFDLLMLSVLPSSTIYAYEPIESNIKLLQQTIEANPAIRNNISLHQLAVTGKELGSIELYTEPTDNNQVVASVFSEFNARNTKRLTVPSISLTEIIKQNDLDHIDILKVDCEGSEYDIFYNTDTDLLKRAKTIIFEAHDIDAHRQNFSSLKSHLASIGYLVTQTPLDEGCFAAKAILSR